MGIAEYYYKDGRILDKLIFDSPLHREDGPAIKYEGGDESWYIDGYLHRDDGPAIKWKQEDGSWEERWMCNGNEIYYYDIDKVKNCKRKEDLLEHLLDNRSTIRCLAGKRLEEIENSWNGTRGC